MQSLQHNFILALQNLGKSYFGLPFFIYIRNIHSINRQTFDLSVKMPGSVHMSVNYKEQTISVIGSDNQVKRLYKVTTAANQS